MMSCWFAVNEESVTRPAKVCPYERLSTDPVSRTLWIYTLDPGYSQLGGGVARVEIPFERLEKGPAGKILRILDDLDQECANPTDLDDRLALMNGGYAPSPGSKDFRCQMLYAVATTVYNTFRSALGRYPSWAANKPLSIVPFKRDYRNAHYDPATHSLCFGTFETGESSGPGVGPGQDVYACLSHDIVAHEIAHALVDGLRQNLRVDTNPDVPAFHEAFADLVAVFHHFTYRSMLEKQIERYKGDFASGALAEVANQFGYTYSKGKTGPLRTAVDPEQKLKYDPALGTYELGSVLLAAVFDAFLAVYSGKVSRDIRLATGGSGILPPGNLNADLVQALADKASSLAKQFLRVVIRALDYCPPVDVEFGEFLRAMVTADYDLVPLDPFGYREALIQAFAKRRIFPRGVRSLSEDAIRWRHPKKSMSISELSFGRLRFTDDPAGPAGDEELLRRAVLLGESITRPGYLGIFGFGKPGDAEGMFHPPSVESIRASRRMGPNNETLFDLVAEVVQCREVWGQKFYGGATIIIGPSGEIRYTIVKSVLNDDRIQRQLAFRPNLATKLGCSRL